MGGLAIKRALLALLALIYGAYMVSLDGLPMRELNALSPYHRQQAVALMHGHFHLGDSLNAVEPGLAWHAGRVQQVWGLGVAIWLLPFQSLWGFLGLGEFPDRVALVFAFAALAVYATTIGFRLIRSGKMLFGLGIVWLILLCPPLWTLARASQLIFEQTTLYALMVSLGILISLVHVACFESKAGFAVCCFLSAIAAWVRPTHGVYGLFAVAVSSALMFQRISKSVVMFGLAGWLASMFILGWTNKARFGAPLEFGHRLTISTQSMMYFTRFGNPFQNAGVTDAVKELCGLLFLARDVQNVSAFSPNMFPGQSSECRWRKLEFTTFDLSYALIGLISLILAISLTRGSKMGQGVRKNVLFFWSAFSFVGMVAFYLRYPVMASRYLIDFAPALVGFAAFTLLSIPERFAKIGIWILGSWLLWEIGSAKLVPATSPSPISKFDQHNLTQMHLGEFHGSYNAEQNPVNSGITWNGLGWEVGSGIASDVIVLVIDQPDFIELHVSPRRRVNGGLSSSDAYQAMLDSKMLSLQRVVPEENGIMVIFQVPERLRAAIGNQALFLCFSKGYEADDRDSERFLYSVRWK